MPIVGLRFEDYGNYTHLSLKPKPLPRILIVEDHVEEETVLLRQLRKANFRAQVKLMGDGAAALHYLSDEKSRCEDLVAIFLDFYTPKVSGLELLEAIRSIDRVKHLPVILMSSLNSNEDLDRYRELGVSSYVRKPVSFAAFTKAVADSFHTRRDGSLSHGNHID